MYLIFLFIYSYSHIWSLQKQCEQPTCSSHNVHGARRTFQRHVTINALHATYTLVDQFTKSHVKHTQSTKGWQECTVAWLKRRALKEDVGHVECKGEDLQVANGYGKPWRYTPMKISFTNDRPYPADKAIVFVLAEPRSPSTYKLKILGKTTNNALLHSHISVTALPKARRPDCINNPFLWHKASDWSITFSILFHHRVIS